MDGNFLSVIAYVTVTAFLSVHIIYLCLFLTVDATIMAYINVGSILFYLIMYFFIKKEWYAVLCYLVLFEIDGHMMAASIYMGFDCGFQLCLVGLPALVCFVGYFSKKRFNQFKAIPSCVILLISYGFIYFYTRDHAHKYVISSTWEAVFMTIHAVIVFFFIVFFLYGLIAYTLHLEDKILQDSRTDKLTQIPNRKALEEFYEKIKDNRDDYVLAIYDIDNFKKFNDVNGHLCGDYVLKEIAQLSKDKLYGDFICRWGGEEFVVLSRVDSSYDDTIKKLDSIRSGIELHNFKYYRKSLKSTITMGAQAYEDGMDLDEWIRSADSKLYEGKKNGKNQLVH